MRIIAYSILVSALIGASCWGVPRYSVMYNQSCFLCHTDPSGGGQRSLYGAQFFAYTDLAMEPLLMDQLGKVQPMLNDQVQIGFDARVQTYGIDSTSYTTLMTMQGNLYLNFQLNPKWTFYLDKGLYAGFELYGMGHILPYNGYVKVGRCTPPYGLRLADHKAFVREPLKLGMGWYETGVEIGFHPQQFTFAISVTNGTDNALSEFGTSTKNKAVTARTDVRLPIGKLNVWLGLTGRYNDTAKQRQAYRGVYGGLAFDRFFFMGEIDVHDSKPNTAVVKEISSYAELSCLVTRGLLFKLEHDFRDPNIDYKSGIENMYVIGAEIVPTGFLQLIPNLRIHRVEAGNDYPGDNYLEGEIQFHVFF